MRYNTETCVTMSSQRWHFIKSCVYMTAGLVLAVWMARSDVIENILHSLDGYAYIGSLFAGSFFTTMFTTAPAIVVLGELAQETSPFMVALFGGFGAMAGDYLLFWIVRDRFSGDVKYLLSRKGLSRFGYIFKTKLFQRMLPFLGALVIASPLPDELGLALLGLSKISKDRFLLISFVMNTLGILVIGLVARSVGGV